MLFFSFSENNAGPVIKLSPRVTEVVLEVAITQTQLLHSIVNITLLGESLNDHINPDMAMCLSVLELSKKINK